MSIDGHNLQQSPHSGMQSPVEENTSMLKQDGQNGVRTIEDVRESAKEE